jgi:predicted DNA-binding protein (UPF0278 family)
MHAASIGEVDIDLEIWDHELTGDVVVIDSGIENQSNRITLRYDIFILEEIYVNILDSIYLNSIY